METTELIINPYFSKFRELVEFKENSTLTDLVEKKSCNETSSFQFPLSLSPTASFLTSMLGKGKIRPPIDKLIKRIKNWSESLLDELDEGRLDKEKLVRLKEAAKKILHNQRIIECKIREENIKSKELEKALSILNKRVESILIENILESIRIPGQGVDREEEIISLIPPSPWKKKTFSHSCPSAGASFIPNFISRYLANTKTENYQKERERLKEEVQREKLSIIFSSGNIQKYPETWKQHLIEDFKKLENAETISMMAELLSDLQISEILRASIKNEELHPNMVYFIVSLPYEKIANALQGMEEEEITVLNQILHKSPEISHDTFQELFRHQRQTLVEACNDRGQAIDALDKRFREVIAPKNITHADINDIIALLDNIKQHMAVFYQYRLLFASVINDSESNRLIFGQESELEASYQSQIRRLSDDDKVISKELGCPFGIIHRWVFDDNLRCGVNYADYNMDEEEAYEIFGAWKIFTIEDWHEVGLFGDINPEALKKINPFKYGKAFLMKLGIATIKDLKVRHIYNRNLLKDYILNYGKKPKSS